MEGPNTKNVQATVKQVNTFDDKRAEGFLEWQAKVRTGLILYNRLIPIALHTNKAAYEPGHRQQARADLRVKRYTCSRAELHRMNHTKMTPGKVSDESRFIMYNCRDCLHARTLL